MTAENNEMKNKNQEMDEHQKLTLDIIENYSKSDFDTFEKDVQKNQHPTG